MATMHDAIIQNDTSRLRTIIGRDTDNKLINARDPQSRTPLAVAVLYGRHEAAGILVEAKADVNTQTKYGWTPTMLCLDVGGYNDRMRMLRFLVSSKTSLDLRDRNGFDTLLTAASSNHFEAIRYLVECKADIDSQTSQRNPRSSLMFAADHNCLDEVKYMCEEAKASVDGIVDGEGCPALYRVVQAHGRNKIVAYLLNKAKADIHLEDKAGRNCLMVALGALNECVVLYLLRRRASELSSYTLNDSNRCVLIPEWYAETSGGKKRGHKRVERCQSYLRAWLLPRLLGRDLPPELRMVHRDVEAALAETPPDYVTVTGELDLLLRRQPHHHHPGE